jgi:hypothetical protein
VDGRFFDFCLRGFDPPLGRRFGARVDMSDTEVPTLDTLTVSLHAGTEVEAIHRFGDLGRGRAVGLVAAAMGSPRSTS